MSDDTSQFSVPVSRFPVSLFNPSSPQCFPNTDMQTIKQSQKDTSIDMSEVADSARKLLSRFTHGCHLNTIALQHISLFAPVDSQDKNNSELKISRSGGKNRLSHLRGENESVKPHEVTHRKAMSVSTFIG